MVNNAGADGSRFDYSNSGSASPFSLRYTRTISRITSPYFSTPFFPKYGMRTSMALSEGSRLLIPRIAFCRMTVYTGSPNAEASALRHATKRL